MNANQKVIAVLFNGLSTIAGGFSQEVYNDPVDKKGSAIDLPPDPDKNLEDARKDANGCIMIGAGVGVAGIVAALASGAVCPLCVVAAPGLIGAGLVKRFTAERRKNRKNSPGSPEEQA